MPRGDWESIKAAFEAAKAAPDSEIDALLDSLCEGDQSRVAFVRSLIRNHREASSEPSPPQTRVFSGGALIGGRLRIVRFIDAGAMGEVYEAYDERLRLRVALKTIRTGLSSSIDAMSRFEREIRIAREVAHPNLCRVFDYIEFHGPAETDSPIPCYTMELIEGESLAQRLARERPLNPEQALPIIRQIASGLNALHERGIVHRDLKPSNIMLARAHGYEPRVVLMDFGLAKLLNSEEEIFQSRTDLHAGAPYFMAPELLRDGTPSVASDLYAFGLIIDEMVTSSRAFAANSVQSLYFAKLWEDPIPPAARSEDLPVSWQAAILRCLSQYPDQRCRRASDVVAAIEAQDSNSQPFVSSNRRDTSPPLTPAAPARHKFRLRRALVLASACAFLATLTLGLLVNAPADASIQVFDIENATNNADLSYLCSGTSNELIRRLSRLNNLRVIPMHTVRKGQADPKIARFSLDGMLRGSNGKVNLSILLSDNKSGEVFDSLDLERIAGDSLQVENDIAGNTVIKMQKHMRLGGFGHTVEQSSFLPALLQWQNVFPKTVWNQASHGPTVNGAAFDSYLRGRQLLDEYSSSSVAASLPYLQKAVAEDPSFALGYVALVEARLNQMTFMQLQPEVALADARKNAEMATTLDPSLAEARAAMAYVLQASWDWKGAEKYFKDALRLKPNFAVAGRRYAGLLVQYGKFDEALSRAQKSFAEDPYDRGAVPGIGLYYYLAGRYDEAIRFLESQIGDSDMAGARYNLGDVYAQKAITGPPGERTFYFEKALAQAERVTAIEKRAASGNDSTSLGDEMYAHYFIMMGNRKAAEPYMARLLDSLRSGHESPVVMAWLYNLNGDADKALDLLDQGLATKDRVMFYVGQFPALASLHETPRFRAIISEMNLDN